MSLLFRIAGVGTTPSGGGEVVTPPPETVTITPFSGSSLTSSTVSVGSAYRAFGNDVVVLQTGRDNSGHNYYITSTDHGGTWAVANGPTGGTTAMTFGNGLFVAVNGMVGYGPAAVTGYYSTDGVNWSTNSLPGSYTINCIGYGNGKFIAIGVGGTALESTDGINWSAHTMYSAVAKTWNRGIQYHNGVWVALTPNGGIARNLTGNSGDWTLNSAYTFSQLVYGNGRWIGYNPYGGSISISTDNCATFTSHTSGAIPATGGAGIYGGGAYGNGVFIITQQSLSGAHGDLFISYDEGATWSVWSPGQRRNSHGWTGAMYFEYGTTGKFLIFGGTEIGTIV